MPCNTKTCPVAQRAVGFARDATIFPAQLARIVVPFAGKLESHRCFVLSPILYPVQPDRQALYRKLTISTARAIPAGTRKTSMKKARPKILANSNSSGILGMHNLTVILLEKQEEIHKTYNAQDRSGARPAPLA
jgi:hypothetical protein